MSDASDYLKKRAMELDLGRGVALTQIQALLDDAYPNQVRAVSLNNGVVKILTPSAPLAGEIRMSQVRLIDQFNQSLAGSYVVTKLHIQIRSI